jgi:hypothetical protein
VVGVASLVAAALKDAADRFVSFDDLMAKYSIS